MKEALGTGALSPLALSLLAADALVLVVVTLALRRRPWRAGLLEVVASALALAALAVAPSLPLIALVVLAAGLAPVAFLREPVRVPRGPTLGAALLVAGALVIRSQEHFWLPRVGAVGAAAGLALCVGVAPYLRRLEPGRPISSVFWLTSAGALLAVAAFRSLVGTLKPDAAAVFAAVLVGFGVVNLLVGTVGAWRAGDDTISWHYSFLADWGLVLVGLGLYLPDALAAAYLLLLALVLGRLPLYLLASQPRRGSATSEEDRSRVSALPRLLVMAALSGAAPFAGFPARLLLLRAAVALSWFLGAVLAIAMLGWLLHSYRLARTVDLRRRPAGWLGWAGLAALFVIGAYPWPFLAAARLA